MFECKSCIAGACDIHTEKYAALCNEYTNFGMTLSEKARADIQRIKDHHATAIHNIAKSGWPYNVSKVGKTDAD